MRDLEITETMQKKIWEETKKNSQVFYLPDFPATELPLFPTQPPLILRSAS